MPATKNKLAAGVDWTTRVSSSDHACTFWIHNIRCLECFPEQHAIYMVHRYTRGIHSPGFATCMLQTNVKTSRRTDEKERKISHQDKSNQGSFLGEMTFDCRRSKNECSRPEELYPASTRHTHNWQTLHKPQTCNNPT